MVDGIYPISSIESITPSTGIPTAQKSLKEVSESTSPTHPLGCLFGSKHGTENSQKSVSPQVLRLRHA